MFVYITPSNTQEMGGDTPITNGVRLYMPSRAGAWRNKDPSAFSLSIDKDRFSEEYIHRTSYLVQKERSRLKCLLRLRICIQ